LTNRRFGFNLGLGLSIMGFISFLRHKEYFIWFWAIAAGFISLAIFYPKWLKPVKLIMDKVIFGFGWIVSAVSFTFMFYIIFTPIGIILRVFRRDLLDQKIDKKANSYWIKREVGIFSKKGFYERMG